MKIQVLPDKIINKISAGEVVERPLSVVRELIDNAIDAGARTIRVRLEGGGRSRIEVSDDGCGMSRDDAILSFERHATSKISAEEDLDQIQTLGFRGEALASIGAVAKVKLVTRATEAQAATVVRIVGGVLRDVGEEAATLGTSVEVRQLFFNTPARRKFLRTSQTEERRVKQWIQQVALVVPGVQFRFWSNGKELFNLPAVDSSLARARSFVRGSSVEFSKELQGFRIAGVIGHPSLALAKSSSLVIGVNGRVVSDHLIAKAVKEGFDTTLKDREYPVGFLEIWLSPEDVDVNVHPQKSEVRFRDARELFNVVRAVVLDAVQQFRAPAESSDFGKSPVWMESRSTPSAEVVQQHQQSFAAGFLPTKSETLAPIAAVVEDEARAAAIQESEFFYSALRYIGQLLDCYLLCEYQEQLYVIDMHAAHERINFNLIREQFTSRSVPTQQLLVPVTIEVAEDGVTRCMENRELFERFGFEVEAFGQSAVIVRSVPSVLRGCDPTPVIKDVAALSEDEGAEGRFAEWVDHIIARIACHASIRSGKKMERDEVYELLRQMDSSVFSAACPHGRPVVVSFSEIEIEKWFGRD